MFTYEGRDFWPIIVNNPQETPFEIGNTYDVSFELFGLTDTIKYNINGKYTGLLRRLGDLVYYNNSVIDYGYNGLVEDSNGNYIFVGVGYGKENYTGMYYVPEGSKYYEKNFVYLQDGIFDETFNGVILLPDNSQQLPGLYVLFENGIYKYVYSGLIFDESINDYIYVSGAQMNTFYKGVAYRHYDGTYWYVSNGRIKAITGLYKMPKTSYYVSDNFSKETWVYFEKGQFTEDYIGLVQNSSGAWRYVENSIFKKYTGLAQKPDGTYWYVIKGKLDTTTNGMTKMPTTSTLYPDTWIYLNNGQFTGKFTGLAYNGKGYYIENSVINQTVTGLIKMPKASETKGGKWVYVKKGKFTGSVTGVVPRVDTGALCYVKDSVYNTSFTGLAKKYGATTYWYVVKGKVDTTKNGMVQMPKSSTYQASNWIYLKDGKFDKTYTGISYNGKGYYYIENGLYTKKSIANYVVPFTFSY